MVTTLLTTPPLKSIHKFMFNLSILTFHLTNFPKNGRTFFVAKAFQQL